jgi:hypothetical protein
VEDRGHRFVAEYHNRDDARGGRRP